MDDVLAAGMQLKWTDEVVTIEEVEQKYGFPQIVKVSAATSTNYNLPEAEPVLLLSSRKFIRLIAQTIEEGHYVMGKQIEIPSEYSGLFKISTEFERDETPFMTFRSIQEVADAFPSKVYIQEQLTVTLSNDDPAGKFSTVTLQKGDELTIISKSESQTGHGSVNKAASRFKSRVRRTQHAVLVVHCTRLNESLSLPLSIQGWFATSPPLLVNLMERRGVISLQQIMEKANFPLTVTVSTNSTRSAKDEFLLRSGMNMKLIGLEEHDVVLAVTPFQRILEFAAKDVTFSLPSALMTTQSSENSSEEVEERNHYQTYVLNAYMNSKLQNSPSNIDDYITIFLSIPPTVATGERGFSSLKLVKNYLRSTMSQTRLNSLSMNEDIAKSLSFNELIVPLPRKRSVRFHVPRNKRPTNPKPLNCNASLRSLVLSPTHQKKKMSAGGAAQGVSAIHLLTNQQTDNLTRRGSRRGTSTRRQLPNPDLEAVSPANPPLPPRNSPSHALNFPVAPSNNYDPSFTSVPPVPPKSRAVPFSLSSSMSMYNTNAAPAPPPPEDVPPSRPCPRPCVSDETNASFSQPTLSQANYNSTVQNGSHQEEEESIWEEFVPPSQRKPCHTDATSLTEEPRVSPTIPERIQNDTVDSSHADVMTESSPLSARNELSRRSDSPCFVIASSKGDSTTLIGNTLNSPSYDAVILRSKSPSQFEDIYENTGVTRNVESSLSAQGSRLDKVEVNRNGDGSTSPQVVIDQRSDGDDDREPRSTNLDELRNLPFVNGTTPQETHAPASFVREDSLDVALKASPSDKLYVYPPADWSPPGDVESLTVREVASSLRFIGISEDVVRMFDNERVDGALLVELSEEIFEQDFNLNKLYRFKIKRFIQGWRPKLSHSKPAVSFV